MASRRDLSFDGKLFFLYDREAVTDESDPPENAIIYFYPASASIESRVSICGQLVGMTNFLSSVLDFAPVMVNLKSEKVALYHAGQYTLGLGGSMTEPDTLLVKRLKTLFDIFVFYHGSLDIVRQLSRDHASFLSNMSIIWDCYIHFIRHYGDTLPAVFNPLPFFKAPKNSSQRCFLKASHILQASQRRQHILGGCILHQKSVLCTQLETSITKRLLLLKPNQSHHPGKQVKTEIKLPFGVRFLDSFLTCCEFDRLIKALEKSPYHNSFTSDKPHLARYKYQYQKSRDKSKPGRSKKNKEEKKHTGKHDVQKEKQHVSQPVPKQAATSTSELNTSVKEIGSLSNLNEPMDDSVMHSKCKESEMDAVDCKSNTKGVLDKSALGNGYNDNDGIPALNGGLDDTGRLLNGDVDHSAFVLNWDIHEGQGLPSLNKDINNTPEQNRDTNDGVPAVGMDINDSVPTRNRDISDSVPAQNRHTNDDVRAVGMDINDSVPTRNRDISDSVPAQNRDTNDGVPALRMDINDIASPMDGDMHASDNVRALKKDVSDIVPARDGDINDSAPALKKGISDCVPTPNINGIEPPLNEVISDSVPAQNEDINDGEPVPNGEINNTEPVQNGGLSDCAPAQNGDINNCEPAAVKKKISDDVNDSDICDSFVNYMSTFPDDHELTMDEINILGLRIYTGLSKDAPFQDFLDPQTDEICKELLNSLIDRVICECNEANCDFPVERELNDTSIEKVVEANDDLNCNILTNNGDCDNNKGREESSTQLSSGLDTIVTSEINEDDCCCDVAIDTSARSSQSDSSTAILTGPPTTSPSTLPQELVSSPVEEFHDTVEDLENEEEITLTEKTVDAFLQSYRDLKAHDLGASKYSALNLNQPDDKKVEKSFFKDLVQTDLNAAVGKGSKAEQSDSARESEGGLSIGSGRESSLSSKSPNPGCPGNCPNTPGDSGLCLYHGSSEGSLSQTDVVSKAKSPALQRENSEYSEHSLCSSYVTVDFESSTDTVREKQEDQAEYVDDFDESLYQIDGLVHVNLFVQAHSNTVLILLAEDSLSEDQETIKALWKTTLNELGELEVHLNQCSETGPETTEKPDDYSYVVYDAISSTTEDEAALTSHARGLLSFRSAANMDFDGNLTEPVEQADFTFCGTAKTVHEQFNNCSSLKSVTLRDNSAAVHCQRSLGQEVYLHKKGALKPFRGSPSIRDSAFILERRVHKQLKKDHGVNVI